MQLDIYTILFMTVVLAALMSGIIALSGRRQGGGHGVREWAAGNLAISLCLALGGGFWLPMEPLLVLCNALMSLGLALVVQGLRIFKRAASQRYFPWQLMALVVLQNIWLAWVMPNVPLRIALNSLIYALVCLDAARLLLRQRTGGVTLAEGFTGLIFAVVSGLLFLRCLAAFVVPLPPTPLLTSSVVGGWTFLALSVMLLSSSFGFVLMLNERLARELERQAVHDWLTGLLNRRGLLDTGERICTAAARSAQPVAVLMADMDFFKSVNDRYGHLAGDAVLRYFAELVRQTARPGDCLGRYGGEEFCLILPATGEAEACALAERLRSRLASVPVWHGETPLYCTLSIGASDSRHSGLDLDRLLADADSALYLAKQTGRDRVVAASTRAAAEPSVQVA